MIEPLLQFRFWQWLVLMIAARRGVGRCFPTGAAQNVRTRRADNGTHLVLARHNSPRSAGHVTRFIGARRTRMKMRSHLPCHRGTGGHAEMYLEAAEGVILFLLAGRYASGYKRKAGAAFGPC